MKQEISQYIYKFKGDNDERKKIIPEFLPKPPFFWVISARRNSGKSQFIYNLIYNIYKDYYDEIYVWCGSKDDCKRYRLLSVKYKMKKKVEVFNDFDFDEIEALYDDIEEQNEERKKLRVLFVFDDILGVKNFFTHGFQKRNVIDRLAVNGRHANISVLIATQKFRSVSSLVRKQATAITIFKSQVQDQEALAEEFHTAFIPKKNFVKLIRDYTREKYKKFTINPDDDKIYDDFFNEIDTTEYEV